MTAPLTRRLLDDPKVQDRFRDLRADFWMQDSDQPTREEALIRDVLTALGPEDATRELAAKMLFAQEYGAGWEDALERMPSDEWRKWLGDIDAIAPLLTAKYVAKLAEMEAALSLQDVVSKTRKLAAVEAERDRLRLYAHHRTGCLGGGKHPRTGKPFCTCGLDATLAGGAR